MADTITLVLLKDKRPIKVIEWDREDGSRCMVGECGVTAIVAYGEPGEYCLVPWLAVYKSDELVHRIPAGHVMISYTQPIQP